MTGPITPMGGPLQTQIPQQTPAPNPIESPKKDLLANIVDAVIFLLEHKKKNTEPLDEESNQVHASVDKHLEAINGSQ
jgi:hypothetical protein